VPLIEQKIKKKKEGYFWVKWVSGYVGEKWGKQGVMMADGGWVRWRNAGGGVSVVGEVMDGGGLVFFGC
jgi:hypothetical protein